MSNYLQLLEEAKTAYETHDPSAYRQALHLLKQAREQAQEASAFFDDENLERQVRRDMINRAHVELDDLLGDRQRFDMEQAMIWLDLWKDAVPGGSDAELDNFRTRARRMQDRLLREDIYNRTREELERLWDEAQELAKQNAALALILERYTEARDIARDARDNNPDYAPLEELLSEAEERRKLLEIEGEEMLSGFQGRQYVRTLKYLHSLDENAHAMTYDTYGNETGRQPKRVAIETVTRHARDYVNSKVREYIDNARRRLNVHEPRSARGALDEKSKFDDLREYIDNLYEPDVQASIEQIEEDITHDVGQLENAEEIASEAEKIAENEALPGYAHYQTALDAYEGARKSETVRRVRETIRSTLINELDTTAETVQDDLDTEDKSRYFTTDLLTDAANRLREAQEEYGNVTDIPLTDRLRMLQGLAEKVQKQIALVQKINEELEKIDKLVETDADNARNLLRALELEVNMDLLQAHPRYDAVVGRINRQVDLQAEYNRLRNFLNNPDDMRVERAIEQAREVAGSNSPMASEFDTLVSQLEVHLLLLRVDSIIRTDGYEIAIERLQRYQDARGLTPDLASRLAERYDQVMRDSETIGRDRETMERARKLLQEGKAEEAYNRLRSIKTFANYSQRSEHSNLISQAQQMWADQIIDWLKSITIDQPFDLDEFNTKLDHLDDLDPLQGEQYRRRMRVFQGIQIARNDRDKRNYADAIEQLESLTDNAFGKQLSYIRREILNLKKRKLSKDQEQYVQVLSTTEPNTSLHRSTLTQLIDIRNQVRTMTERAEGLTRVDYLAWQIDLLMTIAQHSTEERAQRTAFNDANNIGVDLQMWLDIESRDSGHYSPEEIKLMDDARARLQLAQIAPKLSDAIQAVDENVTINADFGLFVQAVEEWRGVMADHRTRLKTLAEWYDKRENAVKTELVTTIQQTNDERGETVYDPYTLPLYAKLLILDDGNDYGQTMLRALPSIAQDLKREVEDLRREIFEEEGVAAGGDDVLEAQISTLRQRRAYINLIKELANRFRNIRAIAERSVSLQETTSKLIERLEEMLSDLTLFQTRISDFIGYLNSFDLIEDADSRWEQAASDFDEKWAEFQDSVDKIAVGLVTHPNMAVVHSQLQKRKAEVDRLVTRLKNLRDAIRQEYYVDAQAIIDDRQLDTTLLERTSLYETYRVPDALSADDIIGWEDIVDEVAVRARHLSLIRAWGSDYAMPKDAPDDPTTILADDIPAAEKVIDWPAEKVAIEALVRDGHFSQALSRLDTVTGTKVDDDGLLQGRYSLKRAIKMLEDVPLAQQGEGAYGDYQAAERDAGSHIGKRLIRWMRHHRYDAYREWSTDAQALRKQIEQQSAEWERAVHSFADAVAKIGQELSNTGLLGRVKNPKVIHREVERADAALGQMERISRNHSEIDSYRQNKNYQRGKDI
jgi:hypoxanthine phosphoribosyltransferase